MHSIFLAPFAVLLELYFLGDKLLVLARPVVDALTVSAGEFDELVLGHTAALYRSTVKSATRA